MKKNSSNLLFMSFMLMGILVSVSANNWLGCWMGIEINLISFLPIMLDKESMYSSESMMKYFIVQSMGSGLFLMSIIFVNKLNLDYVIMVSLMVKMGCPPFHVWYPSVMEGLSWKNCFILSTFQKVITVILLSYLMLNMVFFVILSSFFGSIGGLNYSSMRKIIAYSTIYNLGWIIMGLMMSDLSWLIYFLIYSVTLMVICFLFYFLGVSYLNQFFFFSKCFFSSIMIMIMFMSLSGLPPMFGFFPKMIMIYCLLENNMLFPCFVLVMTALLTMFFYLRVVFTGLMVNNLTMKISNNFIPYMVYVFGMLMLFGSLFILIFNFYF